MAKTRLIERMNYEKANSLSPQPSDAEPNLRLRLFENVMQLRTLQGNVSAILARLDPSKLEFFSKEHGYPIMQAESKDQVEPVNFEPAARESADEEARLIQQTNRLLSVILESL